MARFVLSITMLALPGLLADLWRSSAVCASEKLDPVLTYVEQRLGEEVTVTPGEPNSLAYLRALGERPARTVSPKPSPGERVLNLDECLRLAFIHSRQIEQDRAAVLAVGGSRLIANSRFLPSIEIIGQYETLSDRQSAEGYEDSGSFGASITSKLVKEIASADPQRR